MIPNTSTPIMQNREIRTPKTPEQSCTNVTSIQDKEIQVTKILEQNFNKSLPTTPIILKKKLMTPNAPKRKRTIQMLNNNVSVQLPLLDFKFDNVDQK